MYAPNPQEGGSSVSHWDTVLTPDELMEPIDTGTLFKNLTEAAYKDMGWTSVCGGDPDGDQDGDADPDRDADPDGDRDAHLPPGRRPQRSPRLRR